eukprot:8819252-Pyramimonas_sp.AAC.1
MAVLIRRRLQLSQQGQHVAAETTVSIIIIIWSLLLLLLVLYGPALLLMLRPRACCARAALPLRPLLAPATPRILKRLLACVLLLAL